MAAQRQGQNKATSVPLEAPTRKCNLCEDTGIYKTKRWSESGQKEITIPTRCTCEAGASLEDKGDPDRSVEALLRKDKIERALKRCNIAKRFADIGIKDLDSDKVEKMAKTYFNAWEKRSAKGLGLYFWGGVGSGKTFTALAIANDIRREKQVEMLFFNFAEMMYRIRKGYDAESRFDPNLLEAIKRCELLVIDDIGLEKATDWITEQLYMVINYRYEQMLPTIVTSNQSPEDLGKLHNHQIASRLTEMSTVVKFTGKDRRESKPLTAK